VGRALVIAAIVIGAALVLAFIIWAGQRAIQAPQVRRRALSNVRAHLANANGTVELMLNAADNWKDVDSVLATEIRRCYQEYRKKKEELEK
jgi:hypothetical protein